MPGEASGQNSARTMWTGSWQLGQDASQILRLPMNPWQASDTCVINFTMTSLWLKESHCAKTSADLYVVWDACRIPRSHGACVLSRGQTFSCRGKLRQFDMIKARNRKSDLHPLGASGHP